ncbi:acyl-CoA dehydrogenase family protein [Novosphingobium piscinae]|uniref:Acyl-CoA dehydrogenase family protein n=1 Tax=Novosphingobium piscinae TaxID=1507448 RepID=A0A7X1FXU7_9SPHN|nr:acyl-CoA dehydrogenase family protein [Novosphingobium piscinae]MBC2668980.1 acyl-CoA dehydrogenase family protein [Novosphingobium piscinae]
MNFDLSEDEEMLKALAERFITDHYDMDRRRRYLAEPAGFSPANWALLGELGLIGALFDEDAGGLGLDATGIATVFEAMGRGLVVEPLIENVLLAGRLLAATASADVRADWLPGLVEGSRRVALAHAEQRGRPGRLWIECRAGEADDGPRITGHKAYVPAGAGTDGYIVSARHAGPAAEPEGVALYLVTADAPGLVREEWRLADGGVAVSLTFSDTPALLLAGGVAAIESADVLASLARSAEALGIMERIFGETREYLTTREQFGLRLGSFQAIQHRMVAQYAAIEQARALLNLALVSWGKPEFAQAVAGVRAFIGSASIALGHEMTQFHGGMGVSDELSIGHAHKRLLVLSRWPDEPDAALDRFAGVA